MTKSSNKQKPGEMPSKRNHTTKKEQLIKLLSGKTGADIAAVSRKLGWQHHTTRAALSRLRKAGFQIGVEKPAKGGTSKYRILTKPTPTLPAGTVQDAG